MKKTKKIIIAAGGTGGHLFPAQQIAESIKKLSPLLELLFVGDGLKNNPFFNKEFSYLEICSAHFVKKMPHNLIKSGYKICKGVLESIFLIYRFKPDLVLGFGSFHTLPMLSAALILNVPFILHEQNSIPGKVNRLFSPFAKWSAISFPNSESYLRGKSIETQFPLKNISEPSIKECYEYFALDEKKFTILILGGSQGAKSINNALKEQIGEWKKFLPSFQLIHLTGFKDKFEDFIEFYEKNNVHACVKPFEKFMHKAWKIADVVISRAGAATIFEEIHFEKPSILIPYPHAAENHQYFNAQFFTETVKGGVIVMENAELALNISQALYRYLKNDYFQLTLYQENIRKYKKNSTSKNLIHLIFDQLGIIYEK